MNMLSLCSYLLKMLNYYSNGNIRYNENTFYELLLYFISVR